MLRIGNVTIKNRVISAPMAGITDRAYRILAKEAGCGLVCTEMISDQALLYGNPKTNILLDCTGETPPISMQIFGSSPEYMARAASITEARGASIIDINMGCPTPKIVKNGEGAALMRKPELAQKIISDVVQSVRVPVTVKIRKGWDESFPNAVEMALLAEEAGAKAVTVHGRTRSQFYSGKADWDIIKSVKKAVTIPVIGNGDIREPRDAVRMLMHTGCDAVMIGRASLGNPWIFSSTVHFLDCGENLPAPSPRQRLSVALRHLELLIELKGEYIAIREMRKHAAWYTRGLREANRIREKINRAVSLSEIRELLNYFILVKN
ncbi:TIM-barrel protein, nifR3 family [Desulfofarcimen acetoxidans DSM 771]|uniref:tRNA-dihydrouridine synthase n=1 Tax=Desulfofarcimen acetoxidans (strain ATCC 49208 / DSM 771 / KCTC 5769 / VKM B-1644 / 5575) TaxID=485916 RepID=C8W3U6_DESAS|nr:tRNA dihydrouridine synthase DusB [Desulfofarcimen acetoxidans]ACV61200.1 TIM-barrel protein, nifR3 family [Desulfofarcimen acetoxidans DSM 771]